MKRENRGWEDSLSDIFMCRVYASFLSVCLCIQSHWELSDFYLPVFVSIIFLEHRTSFSNIKHFEENEKRHLECAFCWSCLSFLSTTGEIKTNERTQSTNAAHKSWGRYNFRDHSPFLGTESSFYRRLKINKYTRRLLKTPRWRLHFTLWPYEDYSITHDDSSRMTRWGAITWWELLHETCWLDEDDSTRVTRRGDDSKRTTRRGPLAKVVRVVCEGHLFCELCWRVYYYFFSIIWNVQSIINYI